MHIRNSAAKRLLARARQLSNICFSSKVVKLDVAPKASLFSRLFICATAAIVAVNSGEVSASPSAIVLPSSATIVHAAMQSQTCSILTYDTNGNRLSQSSSPVPLGQSVWGTSIFGCSRWG